MDRAPGVVPSIWTGGGLKLVQRKRGSFGVKLGVEGGTTGREGRGRDGGRDGRRERGREGGRDGGREGRRVRGRKGGRDEGERICTVPYGTVPVR